MLLLLCSCFNANKKSDIDYVEIYYLQENMRYPMRIDCAWFHSELFNDKRKYVKIQDEQFIEKFDVLYQKLNGSKGIYKVDTRIQVVIHSDKKTDTICMGEHFSTSVNGERKKDSPELLKLIKESIYK